MDSRLRGNDSGTLTPCATCLPAGKMLHAPCFVPASTQSSSPSSSRPSSHILLSSPCAMLHALCSPTVIPHIPATRHSLAKAFSLSLWLRVSGVWCLKVLNELVNFVP